MDMALVKSQLLGIISSLNPLGDASNISNHDFMSMLANKEAVKVIKGFGVDIASLIEFAEVIFQSDNVGREYDNVIPFDDFIILVMKLRGNRATTVNDILDLRKFLRIQHNSENSSLLHIEAMIKEHCQLISGAASNMHVESLEEDEPAA